jgi:tetratricopeptide (TPR) repeat protein
MNTSRVGPHFPFAAVCALLCVATAVPYWQTGRASFLVSYDDELYVTANPHVLSGVTPKNLAWAFSTFETGNWHPLTWMSHMLDCTVFGPRPGAHHLMNLAFHIGNVILLFYLLWTATGSGWKSGFAAALFALHPVHVESVAWISERKDVLSTMFWLCTTLCYVRYVKLRSRAWYGASVACFALGLMAKPMLVTLPFALLVFDVWPLCRVPAITGSAAGGARARVGPAKVASQRALWSAWRQLALEKIPLFIMSIASCVVAYVAQSSKNAVVATASLSLLERTANAVLSYGVYLRKIVLPVNLACFYPFPPRLPVTAVFVSLCVVSAISVVCLKTARRKPFLLAGWLWYLGTLVPVVGLVQVGLQSMADRYTYVPSIGIFVMIAWGAPEALAQWRYRRQALSAAAAALVIVLMVLTHAQAGYWKDSVALFGHAAAVTRNNDVAYLNMGVALSAQGKTDAAIASFEQALAARPYDSGVRYDVFNNLGIALARKGKTDEALAYYRKALDVAPDLAEAHFNCAAALAGLKKNGEALDEYEKGLRGSPNDAGALANMGDILVRKGRAVEAIDKYKDALRAAPASVQALCGLGRLAADQGKLDEAIDCFTRALRIRPDHAVAHINLGVALAMQGKIGDAEPHFKEAVRLNPKSAEAHADLARAMAGTGNQAGALDEYAVALRLDSSYLDAHLNYGALLAGMGRSEDAARQFLEALALEPGCAQAKKGLDVLAKNHGVPEK